MARGAVSALGPLGVVQETTVDPIVQTSTYFKLIGASLVLAGFSEIQKWIQLGLKLCSVLYSSVVYFLEKRDLRLRIAIQLVQLHIAADTRGVTVI